jgi:SAM-dependent methyltransferase
MSYDQFLSAFAQAQGVASASELLTAHADQYSFQINSRDRAKHVIAKLIEDFGVEFQGLRVLDVGCAYGSFAIEMAKAGAHVVGIDISTKWLALAEANAKDEAEIKFLNCDASSCLAASLLQSDGPFDLFIVNDVFEHIYDTAGLVANLAKLGSAEARVYYKIPNGLSTRHVLSEGHKKVFGISLLPPDYWHEFVSAPFHIYYRRWQHFQSIFSHYGFSVIDSANVITDDDIDTTKRFIINDVNRLRRHMKAENFDSPKQFAYLRTAARYYYEEVKYDLDRMEWDSLFHKYRVTFWEGLARRGRAGNSVSEPIVTLN